MLLASAANHQSTSASFDIIDLAANLMFSNKIKIYFGTGMDGTKNILPSQIPIR